MLKSARDSLALTMVLPEAEGEAKARTILGMSYKEFVMWVLTILVVLVTVPYILILIWKRIKKRRNQYLNSEKHYFTQLKKATRSKDATKTYNTF